MINIDNKVLTVEVPAADVGWSPGEVKLRQWGVTGRVIAYYDEHGQKFVVRHDDGTVGYYEYEELRKVLPRTVVPSERDFCKAALQAIDDYEENEGELGLSNEQWIEIVKAIYAQVFACG
jgi:hypothetical protein